MQHHENSPEYDPQLLRPEQPGWLEAIFPLTTPLPDEKPLHRSKRKLSLGLLSVSIILLLIGISIFSLLYTQFEPPPGYFVDKDMRLAFYEPLTAPGPNWKERRNPSGGTCRFTENAYHITQLQVGLFYVCGDLERIVKRNYTIQVEMMILHGDCAALLSGYHPDRKESFLFRVCSNGHIGIFERTDGKYNTLDEATYKATALKNNWQTLGLEVSHDILIGYLNGQQVIKITGVFSDLDGNVALAVESIETATEVAYRNLKVWQEDP